MLGENIKILRKQKGYSQQTLADQLNVVRQTISKWEKGYSVPDVDMLEKLSNLFEVDASELLGHTISDNNVTINNTDESDDNSNISKESNTNDNNAIVNQLVILNEQLAKQNRDKKRIIRIILTFIASIIGVYVLICIVGYCLFAFVKTSDSYTSSSIEISSGDVAGSSSINLQCTLDGETYYYQINYDENEQILSTDGDQWIEDNVPIKPVGDVNEFIDALDNYFIENGGFIEIIGYGSAE